MSVVLRSANELGLFAAIAVHIKAVDYDTALGMAHVIGEGNTSAYNAQYRESEVAPALDDIEKFALEYLKSNDFECKDGTFGNFTYNMITNDGVCHVNGDRGDNTNPTIVVMYERLKEVEEKVRKFYDAEERKRARAAQDAVAYNEVGQLPVVTKDECKAMMEARGAKRVIYATFKVDESDSMTDYFGGRSGRQVIIGFSPVGKESFARLRKAAAEFPPTAEFGPGMDDVHVFLTWDHNYADNPNGSFMHLNPTDRYLPRKDSCLEAFHWYSDEYDGPKGSRSFEFKSMKEANEWIANNPALKGTKWESRVYSYEHRENYSMGGGNYLGHSRYSGWVIKSSDWPMGGEYFEPAPAAKSKPVVKSVSEPVLADLYSANV